MAVAVVIKKRAARPPAAVFLIKPRLARDIRESSVSVVMEENVATPEGAEQVIPSIVVVVAHANARLPTGSSEPGFLSHVGEGAVAIVFKKVRGRLLAG